MTGILSPGFIDLLAPYCTTASIINLTSTSKLLYQDPALLREARKRFPAYFQLYDLALLVFSSHPTVLFLPERGGDVYHFIRH